jgi:DNA polymerase III epsilon subunit-like protein
MADLIGFLCGIKSHLHNPAIKSYCQIYQIDLKKLALGFKSKRFRDEVNKLVTFVLRYPFIIYNLCCPDESKLKFLQKFSSEQTEYVTNLDTSDTKLLACAGSGKTRSIIGRIRFMVQHLGVPKSNVHVITFSKFASNDFRAKIQSLFPDFEEWAQLKNFSTIDSQAKSVLSRVKSHKSENVEILSIAFRNYLQTLAIEDIPTIRKIKQIDHLFVDEAQDLNQVQFDIISLLQTHFKTRIHLIGDPNQNIYQFRRSSSSYLMNFKANPFHLSLNFRSTQEIIDFSECLKPIKTKPTVSATKKRGPAVVIISKSAKEVHQMILNYISKCPESGIDLSEVAIICPTKGTGKYNTAGLSVFFNLFKMKQIPFKQLYDESGSSAERKRDIDKVPGHVSLLTWHGTKGLEFDTVFVMDIYHKLFNILPSEPEHLDNRYLMYVACTRAKRQMFCCTYTDPHNGIINQWASQIDLNLYVADGTLKISQSSFRSELEKVRINGIVDIICEMSDVHLDRIDNMIQIVDQFERRIYADFTQIDRNNDESLFGIWAEELFYLQYKLSRKVAPRRLSLIELIIESKFIIVDNESEYNLLKNFVRKNNMTWELYDSIAYTVRSDIKNLIEKYFNRNTEMTNCVICTNEFVQIIKDNLFHIKESYTKYLNPNSYQYHYQNIIQEFFYLVVVCYAYDNNHYFYINWDDKSKHILLENGKDLFETINQYVNNNYWGIQIQEKIAVSYPKMGLLGEIDFMEVHPNSPAVMVDIKCTKEISIKYYIQLLMYNFCRYWQTGSNNIYYNHFKILNLLTGIEHTIIFKINPADMFNILNIFAETGNLKFSDMTLIYDLETTNQIQFHGPMNFKPDVIRGRVWQKGTVFHAETYPEITEIAIRDYDTNMIILNQLVKPRGQVHPEVERLTGIWNRMLVDKDNIDQVRSILESKFKYFGNGSKLLAHNGTCFDHKIIQCDRLVDPLKFTLMDTMSLIPIHMKGHDQLKKKSVVEMYKQLFGKKFVAHRAMADVIALIRIMKHLDICF